MAEKRSTSRILEFALIFGVVYLLTQGVTTWFFPKETPESRGITIGMQDATLRIGQTPVVTIRNGTQQELRAPDTCPMPPFDVWKIIGDGDDAQREQIWTTQTAVPCTPLEAIPAGGSTTFDLKPWKYSLFGNPGTYEIRLPIELPESGSGEVVHQLSTTFSMSEPNAFINLFRGLITKPMLFVLISVAQILPGHSLGWSIIILTLIVKLLLFIPTQQALEGQRKMQILQPKLDEVRQKYKSDPVKMQQETMRLWKENKINPFQSCLPLLLQFPVLIGLFFVIRDGSVLETSREYLYPIHEHLSWTFGHMFLGIDLTKTHLIFPPLLVVLQFIQMKLTFLVAKRKTADKKPAGDQSATEMQQKIMLYGLPLMIGYFALQFPSAVSLYWAISTVFAIGQQIVVNREHMVRHGTHVDVVDQK